MRVWAINAEEWARVLNMTVEQVRELFAPLLRELNRGQ